MNTSYRQADRVSRVILGRLASFRRTMWESFLYQTKNNADRFVQERYFIFYETAKRAYKIAAQEYRKEIANLALTTSEEVCLWKKQRVITVGDTYFTEYRCCRHTRGTHKTFKETVSEFCQFCSRPILLENY